MLYGATTIINWTIHKNEINCLDQVVSCFLSSSMDVLYHRRQWKLWFDTLLAATLAALFPWQWPRKQTIHVHLNLQCSSISSSHFVCAGVTSFIWWDSILDLDCSSETPSFNCCIFRWSQERFRGTDQTMNSSPVLVVEYMVCCQYHVTITFHAS